VRTGKGERVNEKLRLIAYKKKIMRQEIRPRKSAEDLSGKKKGKGRGEETPQRRRKKEEKIRRKIWDRTFRKCSGFQRGEGVKLGPTGNQGLGSHSGKGDGIASSGYGIKVETGAEVSLSAADGLYYHLLRHFSIKNRSYRQDKKLKTQPSQGENCPLVMDIKRGRGEKKNWCFTIEKGVKMYVPSAGDRAKNCTQQGCKEKGDREDKKKRKEERDDGR